VAGAETAGGAGRGAGDAGEVLQGRDDLQGGVRNSTLPHETSHASHWSTLCCGEKVALYASKAPQHLGGGDYVPHLRDVSPVPATQGSHPCALPAESLTSRAFRGGHSLPGPPRNARDAGPHPLRPGPSPVPGRTGSGPSPVSPTTPIRRPRRASRSSGTAAGSVRPAGRRRASRARPGRVPLRPGPRAASPPSPAGRAPTSR